MSRPTQPTTQVVLLRIRNHIIDTLGSLASFEEQRAYARNVPICFVPYELLGQWGDWVDEPRDPEFREPIFTQPEVDAIERFDALLDAAAKAIPKDFPPLEDVLIAPYWTRLRDAAQEALAVFLIRGKLSEDVEAS